MKNKDAWSIQLISWLLPWSSNPYNYVWGALRCVVFFKYHVVCSNYTPSRSMAPPFRTCAWSASCMDDYIWVLMVATESSKCEPLTAKPISLCLEKYKHLKWLGLVDYIHQWTRLSTDWCPHWSGLLLGSHYRMCEPWRWPCCCTYPTWMGAFLTCTQDEAVQELC